MRVTMNKQLKELANSAANKIADQFSPGSFDDRMVADIASIIYKHHKKFTKKIKKEAYQQGRNDECAEWQQDFADSQYCGDQGA